MSHQGFLVQQDDSIKGDEILHIDGGPYYTESQFEDLIPEPYNMVSAIIFMFIALYWFVKAQRQHTTSFRFLKLSSVILAIGGLGGTIYHGFRLYQWAMFMDWIPILVLCIAAAAYFIYRIYKNIWWAIGALLVAVLLQVVNFTTIPDWLNTSTSYGILGLFILIPLVMALVKTKFLYWQYPTVALIAFILALTFRIGDRYQWLSPIGTHFLWHTFGAIACHAMFSYLFHFKRAFPRFELVNKFRLRKIRLDNLRKAREKILNRKSNDKSTS
ncbi:hypothetical protein GC194_00865 [bacterium]|nr:hypothetical protein [bacterium]